MQSLIYEKKLHVYLGYGVWIKQSTWNLIKSQPDKKIVNSIFKAIWGDYILVNRSVEVNRCKVQVRNRSPRRDFNDQEILHVQSIYIYY